MDGLIFQKKSLKIISEYDFLIHTSNFDANPSTVLEAMSWGLIPIQLNNVVMKT